MALTRASTVDWTSQGDARTKPEARIPLVWLRLRPQNEVDAFGTEFAGLMHELNAGVSRIHAIDEWRHFSCGQVAFIQCRNTIPGAGRRPPGAGIPPGSALFASSTGADGLEVVGVELADEPGPLAHDHGPVVERGVAGIGQLVGTAAWTGRLLGPR